MAAVLAAVLSSCSAGDDPAQSSAQGTDWWNGPFAAASCGGKDLRYVNGVTRDPDNPVTLVTVSYSELDGRPGPEAVLQHRCPADTTAVTVWTADDDGTPQRIGDVRPPRGAFDVRRWRLSDGALCVTFNRGDAPTTTAVRARVYVVDGKLQTQAPSRDTGCAT